MIDTPNNRRKMIWYVLGMRRVVDQLAGDDDPYTFVTDINKDIEAIKTDWKITDEQLKATKKRSYEP